MTDTHINDYAEAIAAIAHAEGHTLAVENELYAFARAVQGSDELRTKLSDEKLPIAVRLQIVEDLLGGKASATTTSVVSLLVANGRIGELDAIIDATLARSAEARGEAVAEVRSAVPLTDDQKSRLAAALKAQTNRDVSIRNIVDPTVLGGIVTQIGDTLFDGSVRTRLTQLRDAF
ncbi:MAG: ATP synthase F1 subunit delta [Acidimicrobiales bacterium]